MILMLKNKNSFKRGFSIIELVIVIVVIGILSAIVFVAYSGIQQKANQSLLLQNLDKASSQLGTDYALYKAFPDTLELANAGKGLTFDSDIVAQYVSRDTAVPKGFCLTLTFKGMNYYVDDNNPPQEGFCIEHNPLVAPDPPTIAAKADSTSQITVSWIAVGDPLLDPANQIASSYNLQYSTSSTFLTHTDFTDITTTSKVITGLSSGTTYYFRAYSVGSTGNVSAASVAVSMSTLVPPPAGAPVVTCVVDSSTQITVNWTAVSGATSYTLLQSTSSTFASTTTVAGLTGTSTARTGLSQGIPYYFKMYSVNASGNGNTSSSVSCITSISAPDAPTVSVSIPGLTRSASSGPWALTPVEKWPTSGTWYYAKATITSSTCATGTTRQARARITYDTTSNYYGSWTSYQNASTFYGVNPLGAPYYNTIKFQFTTRCYTAYATSSASASAIGCRKSGDVAVSASTCAAIGP